ncbi:DUF4189 domain-containing protein [Oceanicola sp. D3]|uniref:DUF4189 domain-containing protein n=1 Tax=Oceanicola sp. D3 TaxID=2587163 RepID=UPI00111FDA48|nr:DUF4189 domain-containing protein [Oceanicola sp. D3]QDC11063.1 DUF4189 domain-containing protein [Oceanicola sp. D3]
MLKRSTLFGAVVAITALSFTAVSGLVNSDQPVPAAALQGPAPQALAAAYPQAWAMHQAYDEFLAGPQWYGAFAVGADGAFGAVSGYADRSVGRADALAHCATWAEDCRIVAELLPATPLAQGAPPVSGPQAEALIGLRRSYSGLRAFAVDKRGHWGSAWGFTSPEKAEARAVSECRVAQGRGTPPPNKPGYACKVIWVSR